MKKALSIFTLFVALLAINNPAMAGKVSVTSAQTAAINFFKVTAKNIIDKNPLTATLQYTKTEADNTVDFYVFDISPAKGFVIISANDQLSPVIAYSCESNFHMPAQGSSVQSWMNHAGAHIYQATQRRVVANPIISNQWAACMQGQEPDGAKSIEVVVAPLLTTQWAQEPYYNQLCPFNSTDNMRTVTGCVATAMAQIMKFWNYPAQGTGSYGYSDAQPAYPFSYGNQSANFGATTYNWSAMPDSLHSNNPAVATLMYQCGVAVAMGYGDDNQGGSGAYVLRSETAGWKHSAEMAYATYFSYNPNTLQGVKAANYSSTDWLNLMKSELNAGRPIQYEGTDPNYGSHTWVCDGYDANNLLHMNWGWGGFDNGYYIVSSLNPDVFNFSTNEAALIGIQPMSGLNVTAEVANAYICGGNSTTLSAQGPANASYTWTPATGLSCPTCATTLASPAATTVYTITIDSAGLSATGQITVTVKNKINVESIEVTDATCFGIANGTAKVEVSGGTGAYEYLWSNGGDSSALSHLFAGNYGVTITDAAGCVASVSAVVVQPDSMVASITAANAACNLTNASLNANISGGTPSYSFVWNNGQNTSSVSSTVAGRYTVTVSDAAGCSVSTSIVVAQPTAMNVNISSLNTACSLLYATASANVTGSNENFSFLWSNGERTSSINGLSAGTFSVTVTDALGCSSSASQIFAQPDSMNVSIATSNIADNKVYGKAVANVSGGTPQYSYLWNTGAVTSEISELTPGTYTVTITDNKGCIQTAATQISETTGINNPGNNVTFGAYPNPAKNSVTVQLDETNVVGTTLEVRNILGQTLMVEKMSAMKVQIDLSNFANGVYFIALTQGQNTGVKQIVVNK